MTITEDWERIQELDKMWLLEKEYEMFLEMQREEQLPAIVTMQMPKFETNEVESDSFPFS